jgi:hypothetical protein
MNFTTHSVDSSDPINIRSRCRPVPRAGGPIAHEDLAEDDLIVGDSQSEDENEEMAADLELTVMGLKSPRR